MRPEQPRHTWGLDAFLQKSKIKRRAEFRKVRGPHIETLII